jgi:hypothetical protein
MLAAAIAELEFQKEQLRLRLRRGDILLPPGKTSPSRAKLMAEKLKWGLGRVFTPPPPKAKKTLEQMLSSPSTKVKATTVVSDSPIRTRKSTTPLSTPGHTTADELGHDRTLTRSSIDHPWGIDVDSTVDDEGTWVHMVLAVQQHSAAFRAGICPGEVLVAINRRTTLKIDHTQMVQTFQLPKRELVVRVCECDDLIATLQRPMLTLL